MSKSLTIPSKWLPDWAEIKQHVLLNPDYNDATIYSMDSDLITLAALMGTYRAWRM